MSLKETLEINLKLLGVSTAVDDLNKIKGEATKLQTTADRIRLRMDPYVGRQDSNKQLEINNALNRAAALRGHIPKEYDNKSEVNNALHRVSQIGKSPAVPTEPLTHRQTLQNYKLQSESAQASASGYQSKLKTLLSEKYNNAETGLQSEVKFRSSTIAAEKVNEFNATRQHSLRAAELLSKEVPELKTKISSSAPENYKNDLNSTKAALKEQLTCIRKAQANINSIINESSKKRQQIEKDAYAGVDNLVEKSTILTNIDEKKKTDIVQTEANRRQKIQSDAMRSAQSYFQTGFSMHMLNVYALPMIAAITMITEESLKVFAEFDKKFTDYVVKSADYATTLSRTDMYGMSKGTTFGLINSTITAERFAASGIDVAKSQKALTSTMQVATLSEMDYAAAANGVVQTLQAMHMETSRTAEVTDAMINAANASSAELSDLIGWFEYAASAAYRMGVDVQGLSAYLGVLSSTGTPNAGAAIRQMFIQLSKESVQKKVKVKFDFVTDADFKDVDQLIGKLRNYVQSSQDKEAASTEVLSVLEGTANSQQAMNNLLIAEPELWDRVNNAVKKSGTTQDLYNKTTANTGDALTIVATNIEILQAQFGSFFSVIAFALRDVSTAIVTVTTAMPAPFRTLIGAGIAVAGALIIVGTGLIAVMGAMAVMSGATILLRNNQLNLTVTTGNLAKVFLELWAEIRKVTVDNYSLAGSFNTVNSSMKGVSVSAIAGTGAISKWQSALNIVSVGALGYSLASIALQEQMYTEFEVVNLLTASYMALQTARTIPGPAGLLAAGAVWTGYEALMYDKLENVKRQDRVNRMAAQGGPTTTNTNYHINIANANLSSDGEGFEDFTEKLRVSGFNE